MTEFSSDRSAEIAKVLDFYYDRFTIYLATVISYTETLPEEINNQIRDAFTHLSRANKADTIEEVCVQCRAALSHIERANRDCLKVSLIKAREEADNLRDDVVFYHGQLTPSIRAMYDSILADRKEAYQLESRGDENQTDKLEGILRQTMNLSDVIRAQYSVAGRARTRIMRLTKRWFRPIGFLLFTLLGAAVSFLLRDRLAAILDSLGSLF